MDACSFCGKRAAECERLIAGGGRQPRGELPAVAICNECVELCARIIHGPHLPLPAIPREVLEQAGACPTDATEERGGLVVNLACAVEPSEAEEATHKRLFAPYFPDGAKFRCFWPAEAPGDASVSEWLALQIAVYNEPPSSRSP